jgi:hypothetical protein
MLWVSYGKSVSLENRFVDWSNDTVCEREIPGRAVQPAGAVERFEGEEKKIHFLRQTCLENDDRQTIILVQ